MVVQRGLQINLHITTPLSEIIQRMDKGNLGTCKQQYSKSRFKCSLMLNLIASKPNDVDLPVQWPTVGIFFIVYHITGYVQIIFPNHSSQTNSPLIPLKYSTV